MHAGRRTANACGCVAGTFGRRVAPCSSVEPLDSQRPSRAKGIALVVGGLAVAVPILLFVDLDWTTGRRSSTYLLNTFLFLGVAFVVVGIWELLRDPPQSDG